MSIKYTCTCMYLQLAVPGCQPACASFAWAVVLLRPLQAFCHLPLAGVLEWKQGYQHQWTLGLLLLDCFVLHIMSGPNECRPDFLTCATQAVNTVASVEEYRENRQINLPQKEQGQSALGHIVKHVITLA